MEPNHQTLRLRKNANSKIRILGNKFYEIKNLFDKLNIHRDSLFAAGKKIEKHFKGIKNLTPLQNQSKRLKDSLLIWFTENFYSELIHQNPVIFEILKTTQKFEFVSKLKEKASPIKIVKSGKIKKKLANNSDNLVLSNKLLVNTEIDEYGVNHNDDNPTSNNFDFNKLFDFYFLNILTI